MDPNGFGGLLCCQAEPCSLSAFICPLIALSYTAPVLLKAIIKNNTFVCRMRCKPGRGAVEILDQIEVEEDHMFSLEQRRSTPSTT